MPFADLPLRSSTCFSVVSFDAQIGCVDVSLRVVNEKGITVAVLNRFSQAPLLLPLVLDLALRKFQGSEPSLPSAWAASFCKYEANPKGMVSGFRGRRLRKGWGGISMLPGGLWVVCRRGAPVKMQSAHFLVVGPLGT